MPEITGDRGYDIHGHKFRDVLFQFDTYEKMLVSIDYKDSIIKFNIDYERNGKVIWEMSFRDFLEALGLEDNTKR